MLTRRQRGNSLPEALFALALFSIVLTLLLNYHRVVQQGFEAQWQARQAWRYALEQAEAEPQPLPEKWRADRQLRRCGGCLCISVRVTSPQGRHGEITKMLCPPSQSNQE